MAIRIEFTNIARGPWSFEMAMNHAITKTLREHGVPIAARLAFAGVERGELVMTHNAETGRLKFTFFEGPGDLDNPSRETRQGKGYTVRLSGEHLKKHEEDEEL